MTDLLEMLTFGPADDESWVDNTDWEAMEGPPEPQPQLSTVDDWVCEKCGREVPKRRGRKPKVVLCEDHRNSTRLKPTQGTRMSKEASQEHRLKKISGDLQEGLGKLTGTIVPFAPVTGTVVAMQGPGACDAVVQAAAPFPRFLDGLEKAALALPWITIAQFLMAVTLAMAVDFNRLEPAGIAAEMLGVANAAEKAGWRPRNRPQWTAPQPDASTPDVVDRSSVHGFRAPQPPRFNLKV